MWGRRPLCSLSQGQELMGFGVKRKPFYPSDCPAVLGLGQLRGVRDKTQANSPACPRGSWLERDSVISRTPCGGHWPQCCQRFWGMGPDEGASNRGGGQMFRRREEFPTRHRRVLRRPPRPPKGCFSWPLHVPDRLSKAH